VGVLSESLLAIAGHAVKCPPFRVLAMGRLTSNEKALGIPRLSVSISESPLLKYVVRANG
jgi:hypothetical protein